MADHLRSHRPRLRPRRLCRGDPGEPARPEGRDRRARETGRDLPQLGLHSDQGAAADLGDQPLSDPRLGLWPQRRESRLRPRQDRRPQPQGRRPAQRRRQGADEEEQGDRRRGRRRDHRQGQADGHQGRHEDRARREAHHHRHRRPRPRSALRQGGRRADLDLSPRDGAEGDADEAAGHRLGRDRGRVRQLLFGHGRRGDHRRDAAAHPPGRGRGGLGLHPQGADQAGHEDPCRRRRREAGGDQERA